ncbi:MAG: TIGR02302 family protein [Mesorhizobium sp.]|nr:TIGR02302 family protein [Mesorhizobium sp.]
MADRAAGENTNGLMRRLARTRGMTTTVMALERFWPLALPALVIASLFLSLSWFGAFRLMPDWLRLSVAALFALAALASLYPLRFFRWPARAEIDRRIERSNALEHTPVLVQADRLTGADDRFSQALWREHQKRMADRLGNLSSGLPRTGVPERDPWGLRAAALLLLVTAFAFSAGPLGGTMSDAFRAAPGAPPVPPRVDAWVTPPTYTGKPPIFLTAEANRAEPLFVVPQGSALTLRVTGGSGSETLAYAPLGGDMVAVAPEAADPAKPARAGVQQFAATLDTDGSLSLKSGETELGQWAFSIIPDAPPSIAFLADPKRAANGALELAYAIVDDYGAASGEASFELATPSASDARPLYEAPGMPLALPRKNAKDGAAKTTSDLTEHVWAGLPVEVMLRATDAAGQAATSEVKSFRLPERAFGNPLARALVEQRRILALDANRKPRVLDLMDAITQRPDETIPVAAHYLAIKSAESRLKQATTDDQLREVADYLWEIALGIEDGNLSAAEKRLRQAQEALKNALENDASDAEIEKLMAELRDAMQEFLREFAERAARDPNMARQQQNSQELRQSDLERMMDQIENLAKSGAKDKAQELLSQLQDMMNNLQAGRSQQQQGQGEQSEMRQQMDKLGELMRRQQEMMNETHRLDQMQRGQRQRGQDRGEQRGEQGQQGEQGQRGEGMTAEQLAEALRQMQEGQGQLQGDLGDLMKGLEGMGIQPGKGFGEAGEAMGEAGKALGQAQGEQAVGEQGRALNALREGAQDMMQQMQQAMQGEQGGSEEGGRQQNADRDPLGRPRATTGPDFGDSVKVPDEIDVQRAREILEAIRRRLGNALSPEIEKDYLERLLRMQ